ncbi:MAG: Crp/Fnr family transcriptional regulator [Flammeovirgaceae bacterium]
MSLTDSISQLKKFCYAIHELTDSEWNEFAKIWHAYESKRKTILTAQGETEQSLYFITKGVQRAYFVTEDAKEATLVFTYPYSFSGVADSFLTQTPSRYFFETLTHSHYIKTSHQQLQWLLDQHPNFQRLMFKATSLALRGALERQTELQTYTAEKKFSTLLKRSPQVLRLIPHKYLASYLGIDAATFSKLLSTVRV